MKMSIAARIEIVPARWTMPVPYGVSLHDVVLDPDFAKNRVLYFTYFAPPRGEPAATGPRG